MALVNDIDYNSDTGTFLKDNMLRFLWESLSNIDSSGNNVCEIVEGEFDAGLSDAAFNIDNNSPLNHLGEELVQNIRTSIGKLTEIEHSIRADGNLHRQKEAEEYFTGEDGVQKHYNNEVLETLREASSDYDQNRKHQVGMDVRHEGGTKVEEPKYEYYPEVTVTANNDEEPTMTGEPKGPYAGKLTHAFRAAVDYYNGKYTDAKKLYEDTRGLPVNATASVSLETTSKGSTVINPDGTETDIGPHTMTVTEEADGTYTVTYTSKENNTIIREEKYDSDGVLVRETHYDEEGNPKEWYIYTKEKVVDEQGNEIPGLYRLSPTRHWKDDLGAEFSDDGNGCVDVYDYCDKNGKHHISPVQPEANKIGKRPADGEVEKSLVATNNTTTNNTTTNDTSTDSVHPSVVGTKTLRNDNTKTDITEYSDHTYSVVTYSESDKKLTEEIQNSNGITTERTEYNPDGSVKAVYRYQVEEVPLREGVYSSSESRLVPDENGELRVDTKQPYGLDGYSAKEYLYYDNDGEYHSISYKPDRKDVGDWQNPEYDISSPNQNSSAVKGTKMVQEVK